MTAGTSRTAGVVMFSSSLQERKGKERKIRHKMAKANGTDEKTGTEW